MTTADAPAPQSGPPTRSLPTVTDVPAVKALLASCAPGWKGTVTRAEGTLDTGGLSEETNGDGKRTRVARTLTVESIAVRLQHADGRGVRVLYWRDPAARTPTNKPKGYAFDSAWRGRHGDERVAVVLNAGEVKAYVAALEPDAALEAVEQVRVEAARKAAERKTKSAAPVLEVGQMFADELPTQLELEAAAA